MGILTLITGLIKLAGIIADYAQRRQLINAGVAQAVAMSTAATLENIDLARRAKDAMADPAADPAWRERVRSKYQTDE